MEELEKYLKKGKEFHGGVCPGIVIGTRIALAGLRELGMDPDVFNPNLMVFVEIDRCMADAVHAVTSVTLGHKTLKYKEFGKFAATFFDMKSGKAVRVRASEIGRKGEDLDKIIKKDFEKMIENLKVIPEDELLTIEEVDLDLNQEDYPGFPKFKTHCKECGEQILDRKELTVEGRVLCRSCAGENYYKIN